MSTAYVHSRHARAGYTGRRRNVADLSRRSERTFLALMFGIFAAGATIGVASISSTLGMLG